MKYEVLLSVKGFDVTDGFEDLIVTDKLNAYHVEDEIDEKHLFDTYKEAEKIAEEMRLRNPEAFIEIVEID